jgi:tRNA (adenine37-N6)-methyltransferase
MTIIMNPIGVFHTKEKQIPRHWSISEMEGEIVLDLQWADGLRDIQPGEKIVVIFHFHKSPEFEPENLIQHPKHKERPMGVFSICSPLRPNPVGFSVLTVEDVCENVVFVKHADMIDGTPVLDIKPHIKG